MDAQLDGGPRPTQPVREGAGTAARPARRRPWLTWALEPLPVLLLAALAVRQRFARDLDLAVEQLAAVLVVTHDRRTLDVFDALYTMEDGQLESA